MEKSILPKIAMMITAFSLTSSLISCSMVSHRGTETDSLVARNENNASQTWDKLQHTSVSRLVAMQNQEKDSTTKAWIELALISKRDSVNTQNLAHDLIAWREHYPSHPANQLLPDTNTLNQLQYTPAPKQIAVLLPQKGPYANSGQMTREGFLNAYYDNLPKVGKQNIKFYDTATTQNIASLYQKAITDGADFVIGPLIKNHVQQLKNSNLFTSPTLALNYANTNETPANFYEFGLLPEDETEQIANRAHQAGLAHAIVIAPQNAWGQRLVSAFETQWKATGGTIQDRWYYPSQADLSQGIAQLLQVNLAVNKQLTNTNHQQTILENQRRQDFDVIFLFTSAQEGHLIVPLLHYYYAGNVPIYATSSIYSAQANPEKENDLNGVIVCDIPWSVQLAQRPSSTISSDRLYAVGRDAYLLSEILPRLEKLPRFPIYGATGALTLSANHQIHRRIPCISIRNGRL